MLRALLVAIVLFCASPAVAMDGLTHHSVPAFCASPTITATTGNFSSLGATTGSIIAIPDGVTVTYDVNDLTTVIKAICIRKGGTLTFGTSGTLGLRVGTIVVEDDSSNVPGNFYIGNYDTSSQFTGTAEVRFDCTYFAGYSTNTTDLDPAQWNCGLIVTGKIRTYGVAYTMCARTNDAAIAAGDPTITLASTPTGWDNGETILIPESRQRIVDGEEQNGGTAESESRTLSGTVSSTTVTLSSGLTYAHPPAVGADGTTPEKYPVICNVSGHNIQFTSATPNGTRGHTIYLHHADVSIHNTSFIDLGRTTVADLNCSLRTTGGANLVANCSEGTGDFTTVGTNQKGRYAVHFHHLFGPANTGDTSTSRAAVIADPQSEFVGNLIYNATKWGMDLHNTSHALIQNNAFLECDGPCFMTEDGNEHYNVVDGNTACVARSNVPGRNADATGYSVGSGAREPAGFWFNGDTDNYVTNNLACAMHNTAGNIINEIGFKFHNPDGPSSVTKIPNFRGADLSVSGEYTTAQPQEIEVAQFDGNECYSMDTCMTIWHLNTTGTGSASVWAGHTQSILDNMTAWHISSQAYFAYPTVNVLLRNWTMYCRSANLRTDSLLLYPALSGFADYQQYDTAISGANVYNCATGVGISTGDHTYTITNSYFKTDIGIYLGQYSSPAGGAVPQGWGSGSYEGGNPGTASRTMTFSNLTFASRGGSPLPHITIKKAVCHSNVIGEGSDCEAGYQELPDVTHVTNYNNTGMSFEVYYIAGPITDHDAPHAAYAGQDTEADWGGLIPHALGSGCDTTTYPEIDGIVCDIRADSAAGSTRKPRRLPIFRRQR